MAVNEIIVVNTESNLTVVEEVVEQVIVNTTEFKVVSVLAGDQGVPGPAPLLTFPAPATGNAGTNVGLIVTGDNVSGYNLALTIPRGNTGTTGPANTLTPGTITTGAPGSSVSATITGTSPNQTLNLTIPRGDVGATGPAPNLTIGTVSTVAVGGSATATVTGSNPNYVLNIGIPTGATGAIPTFNGTVSITTGAPGTSALASITGSNPYTLNLTVPRGDPGTGNVNSSGTLVVGNIASWQSTGGNIQDAGFAASDVVRLTQTQTITGAKTFSVGPVVPDASWTIAKTNGLQAALDGKSATSHTHALTDASITGILPLARGGTGNAYGALPAGAVITAASSTTMGVTAAGTAGQFLRSAGAATPTWASPTTSEISGLDSALALKAPLASPTFTGTFTSTGTTAVSGGALQLTNSTSNMIFISTTNGVAPPSINVRSAGTKFVLYPSLSASEVDFAFGVDGSTFWSSVPSASSFKWYGTTSVIATLGGTGNLSTNGTITAGAAGFSGPGVNITTLNASSLSTGTVADARFPTRLQAIAPTISDFNLMVDTGFYTASSSTLNPPEAGHWWFVNIIKYPADDLVQNVQRMGTGANAVVSWTRQRTGAGSWGSWYRNQASQYEQDLRYAMLTGAQTIAGIKTFSNGILSSSIEATAGSGSLILKPGSADHAYMQFYARTATPTTRSGYFGYPSAATTSLVLANEISTGTVSVTTVNGNITLNSGTGNISLVGAAVSTSGPLTVSGTVTVNGFADQINQSVLGGVAGNHVIMNTERIAGQTNNFQAIRMVHRASDGTDWLTAELVDGIGIDSSFTTPATTRAYIKRNPSQQTISLGSSATDYLTASMTGVALTRGALNLTNATANTINFGEVGVGSPVASGTRNAGTKLILWGAPSDGTNDYALGVASSILWTRVAGSGSFKWYHVNTEIMALTGSTGALAITGGMTAASFSGVGTALTALNASNLGSGTVPQARTAPNIQVFNYTTGSEARPTGTTYVMWRGPAAVTPVNAIDGDSWEKVN